MLIVIVTVYTVCYFPINIGWVSLTPVKLNLWRFGTFPAPAWLVDDTTLSYSWLHPYSVPVFGIGTYLLQPGHLLGDGQEGRLVTENPFVLYIPH